MPFELTITTHLPPPDATSTEFDNDTAFPVIVFMPEISKTHMGGTMRLGLRPTVFEPDTESSSNARKLYGGVGKVWERHRHRYEVNPEHVQWLSDGGLHFVGKDEKGERMQILEISGMSLWAIHARMCDGSRALVFGGRSPIFHWTPGPS